MAEETAAEAAARARAAQRAAEAPSREAAERAQQDARRRPTQAQASANQAAGGNYADRRNLLINQGQRAYNAAVSENATRMPEPPAGRLTGRGSPSMPAPPSPFGAAANAAGAVVRGATRLNPALNAVTNSTTAARAQLTDSAEGRRMLAEHEARRASDAAAGAAENYGGAGRSTSIGRGEPSVITSGGAEPDAMGARPDAGALARLRSEAQNRAPRANTRSTARMSPRQLTSDELHDIQSHTLDPESGIAEMRGVRGEAARNIIARRADQDRQRELEAMKRGGPVKKMAKGGVVKSSASGRSDGCAVKGKTKGRMV